MKLTVKELKKILVEAADLPHAKRQATIKKIDASFYDLITTLSWWIDHDDFLVNTYSEDIEAELREVLQKVAAASNRFDNIRHMV